MNHAEPDKPWDQKNISKEIYQSSSDLIHNPSDHKRSDYKREWIGAKRLVEELTRTWHPSSGSQHSSPELLWARRVLGWRRKHLQLCSRDRWRWIEASLKLDNIMKSGLWENTSALSHWADGLGRSVHLLRFNVCLGSDRRDVWDRWDEKWLGRCEGLLRHWLWEPSHLSHNLLLLLLRWHQWLPT